jgi:integrase
MDDELLKLLRIQRLREVKGCPYVFHRDGEKIKDFRAAWDKACKAVDMEGKIFHDLRRTAVRNMVRAGIQEQVAMRISGHRTRAVFDRYNIVSPDDLKKAAQKMANFHATFTNTVTIGNLEEAEQRSPLHQVVEINR